MSPSDFVLFQRALVILVARGFTILDNWWHDLAQSLKNRPGRLHSINVLKMFCFLNIENIEVKDQPDQNLFLYDALSANSAVLSLSLTMS